MSDKPHRLAGIAWMLLGSVAFTGMGVTTKLAFREAGLMEVLLWRSVVVAAVSFGILRRQAVSLVPGNLGLMLWRSAIGFIAMVAFFEAVRTIPLGSATALLYTFPVFLVVLSGRLARDRANAKALGLTAVAFVGMLLIVRPSPVGVELGTWLGLGAGFLAALAYLAVRRLRESEPPARIVCFFALFSVVASLPFALTGPVADPSSWWLLALVGVFATGGQLAITIAYRLERPTVVGPFAYATVVLSYLAGVVAFDELLSPVAMAGIACVIVAGAALSGDAEAEAPEASEPAT